MNTGKKWSFCFLVIGLIASLALVLLFVIIITTMTSHATIQFAKEMKPAVESPKVIAAMEYHGIDFATNNNGKRTFERGNQTCRLFTQAFEEKWNRGK